MLDKVNKKLDDKMIDFSSFAKQSNWAGTEMTNDEGGGS